VNNKKSFKTYIKKISAFWKTGKIQRGARITYDIGWNVILFFLLVGFICLFFAGGAGAGYFASLVKDEPIRSYESMEKDIYDYEETSKLYFDNDVYIGNIKSDLHREEVDLENVSELIIQATKATEDQSFEQHKGVVPKAIVRAVMQEAVNSEVKSGGSTLTQQLIKNQILSNEVSFERKAKEILLALRLEHFFSKDQILEAYLNIISYGREASGQNIAGIQTAAQGVFGVDAKDVNLPQAAYLVGLPQSPSVYTPFANQGGLKEDDYLQPGLNRMKTVLKRMHEENYITDEEYKEALQYDIVADFTEQSTTPDEKYPRLVNEIQKRASKIIRDQLLEEDGVKWSDLSDEERAEYEKQADKDLRRKGYRIHSTINKEIFEAQKKVVKNFDYFGPDLPPITKVDEETGEEYEIERPVQTAAVLRENKTGKIISFVGGRETKNKSQFNYATDAPRSPGSTIKPLLDYAPAMEMGYIQPGSPIADVEDLKVHDDHPQNVDKRYHGLVSAREALYKSHNFAAFKLYSEIVSENPVKNFLEKMGVTTLREDDYVNLASSIGTMDMTVLENVNAYSTLANNGKFIDGYMIERIETKDGDIVYEHESESVDVFSPQTSYLTLDIMRDVLTRGTGTYVNDQLNDTSVDWAGKTGTSGEAHDAWFIGTNPNVTFGSWMGYEKPADLEKTCQGCELSYNQRRNKLWAELVNATAEVDPELMLPDEKFERPDGIVESSYCAISGMKPSSLCEKAGLVKTDLFNEKFLPEQVDDSLIKGSFVKVNGKAVVAGKNTPKEFIDGNGYTFNPKFLERKGYDAVSDLTKLYPDTEREKWEKIGLPSGDVGDANDLNDDGKKPATPTSVKHSNGTLSWNRSSSKDVVGYYIVRTDKIDGDFTTIGSTTNTHYNVDKDGVYRVIAADYFGLKSASSDDVIVGDIDEKDEPDDEEDDKNDNNDNDSDNNNDNNGDNDNQKDDGTDKNNDNDNQDNNKDDNNSNDNKNNNDGGGNNNKDNKNNSGNNNSE